MQKDCETGQHVLCIYVFNRLQNNHAKPIIRRVYEADSYALTSDLDLNVCLV